MKNKLVLISGYMLLSVFSSFGQWNIQAGYDFGTYTIPQTNRKNFNSLNRLYLRSEYIFNNQTFFSISSGTDLHFIEYESGNKISSPTGINSTETFSFNKINIQNLRLGISFGYFIKIKSSSSIQMEISYDQYFVNNVSIIESYRKKSFYDVPSEEIDNTSPINTVYEFSPRIDLERFGYRNQFLIQNSNIVFSLGYRYQIEDFFLNASIGLSPWNTGFVLLRNQNLFLLGVSLGYTLPQKPKNNEK